MGVYNFQPQFVPYLLDGSKTHTIRACRARSDRPGDTLHLYTGLRRKGAQLLFRAPCVRIEEIRMFRAQMWINGEELSIEEKNLLAWRDGFRFEKTILNICSPPVDQQVGCFDLMLQFWADKHGTTEFAGHIIHWDYSQRKDGKEARC